MKKRLLIFFLTLPAFAQAQPFTHITTAGGVGTQALASVGGSWNDVNGDNYPDLLITGFAGQLNNRHYVNRQDGTFLEDMNSVFMITPDNWGCVVGLTGDYDNDGDSDVMLCSYEDANHQKVPLRLLTNLGNGTFQPLSSLFEKGSFPSGSWVDYDLDGDLDFFAAAANGSTDVFYKNTGSGPGGWERLDTLSFLKLRAGFITHDSWVDLDADGDLDLYIANFGPPGNNANTAHRSMLKETGNPNYFTPLPIPGITGVNGANIGVNWVDYDNDLDLDLYLNVFQGKDRLYRNDGNLVFTEITGQPMLDVSAYTNFNVWADFDNDGDPDLALAHTQSGPSKAKLYRNEDGNFTQLTDAESGGLQTATITNAQSGDCGDYDLDGDMDLYVVNTSNQMQGAPNFLFRNDQTSGNNWLKVKLKGANSNSSGYGAKIIVTAVIGGDTIRQLRFAAGGTTSYSFQGSTVQHFGLGAAPEALTVEVRWPSGTVDRCTGIAANQQFELEEGACSLSSTGGIVMIETTLRVLKIYPSPGNDSVGVEVETAKAGGANWKLADASGRVLLNGTEQLKAGLQTILLKTAGLPGGQYFFEIAQRGGAASGVWVKK